MENMVASKKFWQGKRVFLTGHTGFKGSWLSLWLHNIGAKVHGYSDAIPTCPSFHSSLNLQTIIPATNGDIRDYPTLSKAIKKFSPDIVIHMAAQTLVRPSYQDPLETISTNIMGTANLLEACRNTDSIQVILNVTSDKCYENKEWIWGYRENDRLGGHDPYSSSKACSEIISKSFQDSYFSQGGHNSNNAAVATVRAGNVIGGGDWAIDRLIPDCIRAFISKNKFIIRHPNAVRPWQYVLDPLNGYLLLAEKIYKNGQNYSGGWNFGPQENNIKTVLWVAKSIAQKLGAGTEFIQTDTGSQLHEAQILKLDSSKAASSLNWRAIVPIENAIDEIVLWTHAYINNDDLMTVSVKQIESFYDYEKS